MTQTFDAGGAFEAPVTFASPGPGHWELDRSHFPGGTTPICQWLMSESMQAGMARVMKEQGVPAKGLQARLRQRVHVHPVDPAHRR